MLAWLDIETTGFDVGKERIVEIAFQITDDDIDHGEPVFHAVVHSLPTHWRPLPDKATEMHQASGLYDESLRSHHRIGDALEALEEYLRTLRIPKADLLFAGNNVHFDVDHLKYWRPSLLGYFSHRQINVSSFREMGVRWGHRPAPESKAAHRAISDLKMSQDDLRLYKNQKGGHSV